MEKINYLLEQVICQMRAFNPDSEHIRSLTCYGSVIIGEVVAECKVAKLQRKVKDLGLICRLIEQYSDDVLVDEKHVSFILQKAREAAV